MQAPPIIHEDDAIIAVAKPAGIATANVPAGEESVFTQVRRLLATRGAGERGQPFLGLVSRLDRPVSGVVVFAKTPAAAADHTADHAADSGSTGSASGAPTGTGSESEAPRRRRRRGGRGRGRSAEGTPTQADGPAAAGTPES